MNQYNKVWDLTMLKINITCCQQSLRLLDKINGEMSLVVGQISGILCVNITGDSSTR